MTNGAILEVEEKYWLTSVEDLTGHLLASGFEQSCPESQSDTYFSDLNGDFVKDNVCLRIRQSGDQFASLDFKGPSVDLTATTISKLERNLGFAKNDTTTCVELLNALRYFEHIVVNKIRTTFLRKIDSFSVAASIDEVAGGGIFVEIEVTTAQLSKEQGARDILRDMRRQLQPLLGAPVKDPYRDIVAKTKFETIVGQGVKVIAFDLDGTIIPHTTQIFFDAWNEVSRERDNVSINEADYAELEVHGSEGLFDLMVKMHELTMSRDEYFEPIYARYSERLQKWWTEHDLVHFFQPLRHLRANFKLALVTHSRGEYVAEMLERADATDLFDLVITRESMGKLKPAPDGYLKVSSFFNVRPLDVLVVEDAAKGLKAALHAGTKVVAIEPTNQSHFPQEIPTIKSCAELVFLWLSSVSAGSN